MWFKVTVAPDGAIRSCEQVSEQKEDGDYVYFVDAPSKPAACSAAKKQHESRLRELRTANGLCRCGRRCGRLRSCVVCRKACSPEERARKAGLSPEERRDEANTRRAETKAARGMAVRHVVLLEVASALKNRSFAEFSKWLERQLVAGTPYWERSRESARVELHVASGSRNPKVGRPRKGCFFKQGDSYHLRCTVGEKGIAVRRNLSLGRDLRWAQEVADQIRARFAGGMPVTEEFMEQLLGAPPVAAE